MKNTPIEKAKRAAEYLIKHPHSRIAWAMLSDNTSPSWGNKLIRCPFDCYNCPLRTGANELGLQTYICGKSDFESKSGNLFGEVILYLIQFVAFVEAFQGAKP